MSKIYVLFVKKFGKEGYVYLPDYEIHHEPVKGKVAELDVGECVGAYRVTLSDDETYLNCNLFTISNIDGKGQETFTESFILEHQHSDDKKYQQILKNKIRLILLRSRNMTNGKVNKRSWTSKRNSPN